MAMCDIYSIALSQSEINRVSASKIIEATMRGYIPSKDSGASFFGDLFGVKLSRREIWHFTVDRNKTGDWAL